MQKVLMGLILAAIFPANAATDFVLHRNDNPQTLDSTANVQIVNFWAAYCKPCLKEMPAMSAWYKKKPKGVELVGIAADSKENVSAFLAKTPVSYPIWRYVGKNTSGMLKSFGDKAAALPYTIVRAPKCNIQETLLGEMTGEALDKMVESVSAKCKK